MTVTTICAESAQLPADTTTSYVVVTVGLANTVLPVVALKLIDGLQLYSVPPLALSVSLCPEHIVGGVLVDTDKLQPLPQGCQRDMNGTSEF
jgi:hypothetical protein